MKNDVFEFFAHAAIQVRQDLFTVREADLMVTRYFGGTNITKKQFGKLDLMRANCSIANYKDEGLYVTGGSDEFRPSRNVFWFDIKIEVWEIAEE